MNHRTAKPFSLIGLAAGVMLAGCSPNGSDQDAETNQTESEPEIAMPEQQHDLEHLTRAAVEDQRDRLGAEAGEISVESAERVTWRSGALGCPDPDMMYTQSLVPGYRIVLAAGKQRYFYHGAEGQAPFPCPRERAETALERDQAEI